MKRPHPTLTLLAAADAMALFELRPRFGRLVELREQVARAGADRVAADLAGSLLWLLAVWLGVGLLATAAARLPGPIGRASAAAARALLPRILQRVAAGSAGLGVLLAPVAAGATGSTGGVGSTGAARSASLNSSAVASPTVPAPTWPLDPPTTTPAATTPSAPPTTLPSPQWPQILPTPRPHTVSPTPSRPRPGGPAPTATETETVRAGDSLWLIAARRLGSDATPQRIAASWPRWFAANASVIGADPDHLVPGEILRAPGPEEQR